MTIKISDKEFRDLQEKYVLQLVHWLLTITIAKLMIVFIIIAFEEYWLFLGIFILYPLEEYPTLLLFTVMIIVPCGFNAL